MPKAFSNTTHVRQLRRRLRKHPAGHGIRIAACFLDLQLCSLTPSFRPWRNIPTSFIPIDNMKTINGVEVLDTLDEILRPAHTALLVVDVQNDFCHPDGHFAKYGKALGIRRRSSICVRVARFMVK